MICWDAKDSDLEQQAQGPKERVTQPSVNTAQATLLLGGLGQFLLASRGALPTSL